MSTADEIYRLRRQLAEASKRQEELLKEQNDIIKRQHQKTNYQQNETTIDQIRKDIKSEYLTVRRKMEEMVKNKRLDDIPRALIYRFSSQSVKQLFEDHIYSDLYRFGYTCNISQNSVTIFFSTCAYGSEWGDTSGWVYEAKTLKYWYEQLQKLKYDDDLKKFDIEGEKSRFLRMTEENSAFLYRPNGEFHEKLFNSVIVPYLKTLDYRVDKILDNPSNYSFKHYSIYKNTFWGNISTMFTDVYFG